VCVCERYTLTLIIIFYFICRRFLKHISPIFLRSILSWLSNNKISHTLCTNTNIHTHTRTHTCTYTHTYTRTHTNTHTHTNMRTAHTRASTHTHIHIHTNTHTHTHTHTHNTHTTNGQQAEHLVRIMDRKNKTKKV